MLQSTPHRMRMRQQPSALRVELFLGYFAGSVKKCPRPKRCWSVQPLQCDPHMLLISLLPSTWRNRSSGPQCSGTIDPLVSKSRRKGGGHHGGETFNIQAGVTESTHCHLCSESQHLDFMLRGCLALEHWWNGYLFPCRCARPCSTRVVHDA